MSIFGRKPLSDLVVPFKFGISILKKPYMQSFMLSAESEHLDHFLLHIRSTTKAHCKYSIGSLRKNIPLAIESITTENIKNHIRKVKQYMFAYLQGIKVGKELDETIKKYKKAIKSHRT